jgi:UDP-glucose 4-epimerase
VRVLVTGGAGRVGSTAVEHLLASGHEVVVWDTSPASRSDIEWVHADVLDIADQHEALREVSVLVHLAAVPRPLNAPAAEIMRVNVLGTHAAYAAAAAAGISRVVLLSSTAVIGTDWARNLVVPDYFPIDESHPCSPRDPYGMSKVLCEELARYASRTWGISTVVMRAPWVTTIEDLEELARTGGRLPEGVHHYAYVGAHDLARAIGLAVGGWDSLSIDGVTTVFTAAGDSMLSVPLREAMVDHPHIPGLDLLPKEASGVCSERAKTLLGWHPIQGWRTSHALEAGRD